jgi:hypothetical protein
MTGLAGWVIHALRLRLPYQHTRGITNWYYQHVVPYLAGQGRPRFLRPRHQRRARIQIQQRHPSAELLRGGGASTELRDDVQHQLADHR